MTEFRVRLDVESGVPRYRQIIDQVQLGIADGRLGEGDQLPTVRQLAVDLSINPNTVAKAYRDLERGGAIQTRRGQGTFVCADGRRHDARQRRRTLDRLCTETAARAQAHGITLRELIDALRALDRSQDNR